MPKPTLQEIEDEEHFARIREYWQQAAKPAFEAGTQFFALHYSIDELKVPLQRQKVPLCFTPRITIDRDRLTLTTGIEKDFRFLYVVALEVDAVSFDYTHPARYEAKWKRNASVWEIQTNRPVLPEEYLKLPVVTTRAVVVLDVKQMG